MSEDLTFTALTAGIGFNDGANKGFWRIQPRDDEGQWIEMGADVLFRFRTGKGNLVVATERGVYVGPSGKPGFARVMVPKDTESGLKAGVYEVESRNLQQFKALFMLPPDFRGYEDVTIRLNNLLYEAYGYVMNADGYPGRNALDAIRAAKEETDKICQRLNRYFSGPWETFRKTVEQNRAPLFKENPKY